MSKIKEIFYTVQAWRRGHPNKSMAVMLAVGCIILLCIIALFTSRLNSRSGLSRLSNQGKQAQSNLPMPLQTTPTIPLSAESLVYGTWTNGSSLLKEVNILSGNTTTVATLPLNIKKITILSPHSLLYIDQTDGEDHGKRLAVYDLTLKRIVFSVPAEIGYGIDDYVVSPNKQFVATWEVAFASGSAVLQGGSSRVYTFNIAQYTQKNLIYDENATVESPLHYPRAILDNGTVFCDQFLPNSGAGWAYGMSVSSFDGQKKQNIVLMQNGMYGTQPVLSPDGRYLAFAGYDGLKGDGKTVTNGFRRALVSPDTVELLDTKTLQLQKLSSLSSDNTYPGVQWDDRTGKLIFTQVSQNISTTGYYSYDLSHKTYFKLPIPEDVSNPLGFISLFPSGEILVGSQDTSQTNVGNLGETYQAPFTNVSLLNPTDHTAMSVKQSDPRMQYITMLPENYFQVVLGAHTVSTNTAQPTYVNAASDNNSLQMKEYVESYSKTTLASVRQSQQSSEVTQPATRNKRNSQSSSGVGNFGQRQSCSSLATSICAGQGYASGSVLYNNCLPVASGMATSQGCVDSPLYLYGPSNEHVVVHIQTPVLHARPAYTGAYEVTLGEKGAMRINGKTYQRLTYEYIPNIIHVSPPIDGTFVNLDQMSSMLTQYARRLGLHAKETEDLLSFAQQSISSPYVFISFYDQRTSEALLPLSFSPMPDAYLNVVFYFRQLYSKPNYTPVPPVFTPLGTRKGFTAVEVSEIVE